MAQSEDTTEMQHQPGLEARLFPTPVQLVDFVREGWRRLSGKEGEKGLRPEIIRSDDFYLTPAFQTGTTILLPSTFAVLGGSPISDEGHTLWYSLYVRTLW